ncbi:uncharacterized protein BCR38DRAFT_125623 [Pseudomassariella vexata]|uniref:Rrn9 domain-containing protein n=1 Tax=Pseudomassariella vexata TaxID=1141098 RepID=A0A1Y2D8D4_9PEZI|nr:uncharacterized protein BCR38DRAFT_125623 [Pseudomassariella vexata]ORY55521.1 hypothetical protein BCR38DRAFT_125623 [Pseudomassariella vexata]
MKMNSDADGDYTTSSDSGSAASERPNRWDGAPSTWQYMNREEINTLTAFNELSNSDLSVHLYNAFMLKKNGSRANGEFGPLPNEDINAATGQKIQAVDWVPQRSWTAWPMSASAVPASEFDKQIEEADADEIFTVRKQEVDLPSRALEEAVSAAMLRFSKAKFESRAWDEGSLGQFDVANDDRDGLSDHDSSESATTGSRSRSRSVPRPASAQVRSIKQETETETEDAIKGGKIQVDGSDGEDGDGLKARPLRPTVATDDQLSYALLRPIARHILSQLDATLVVLHNARETTMSYLSDSSSESEPSREPLRKKRGRPAKAGIGRPTRDAPPPATSQDGNDGIPAKKKGGRPRKIYPRLEGETSREHAIRIARQRKEPIPHFDDDEASDEMDSNGPALKPNQRVSNKSKRSRSKSRDAVTDAYEHRRFHKERNRARLGLRDWRDVLGAAALAGFPQAALDRAARRCADLFGQSMELRTLTEGGRQDTLIRYEPGIVPVVPYVPGEESGGEDNDDGDKRLSQTKRRVRSASIASDNSRGRSSRSCSRGRSRSGSASAVCSHFCSVRGCVRNVEGFSRRTNLLRHLRLVHDMDSEEVATDVDSEDEMVGAVHVDGFLKPIKIRKGWRATDHAPRSLRKPRPGHAKRRDSSEKNRRGDGDITMNEDSQ